MHISERTINYVRRLKGKTPEEAAETLKKTSLYYYRRARNLIRERSCISWVPDDKELFGFLSRDFRLQTNSMEKVISLWEQRLINTFFPGCNSDTFRDLFDRCYPEEKKLICDTSFKLSNRRMTLFRSYEVDLGDNIDWHSTIINENKWPVVYFRSINPRESAQTGDLRTTWELNRHIHWLTLGKAFLLTGNESYFFVFWAQFKSWTQSNPYLKGVNWLSAMEVAIRLNHWLAAYTLFCGCPQFDTKAKIEFWCWAYLHIHFIKYHLTSEDRGFRNNHLIIEAATLYISNLLLRELKDSSSLLKKSQRILSEELRMQFLGDGFHEELCSSYHIQVTESYLLAALFTERCGLSIPVDWQSGIKQLVQALALIAKPDGSVPLLGDSDDGTFLGIDIDRATLNLKTVCGLAALLLGDETNGFYGSEMSEGTFWISGADSVPESEKSTSVINSVERGVLKSAQFAVFKEFCGNGFNYCLFTVGTEKPLINTGHRHADLLSVNLSVLGRDIFVDSGTYCYNGPLKWRRYFQSAISHNTVTINRQDQFIFSGHFGIRRINYRSDLKTWSGNGVTVFRGEYTDSEREAWHCRYVLMMLPDFVLIRDSCGEGEYSEARLNYTFEPRTKVYRKEDYLLCNIESSNQLRIDLYSRERTFGEIGRIRNKWFSPSYWIKEKCPSVTVNSKGSGNFFTTVINISGDGSYSRVVSDSDRFIKESLEFTNQSKRVEAEFCEEVPRKIDKLNRGTDSFIARVDTSTQVSSIRYDNQIRDFTL